MGIELAKAWVRVRADASKLRGDLEGVKRQTSRVITSIGTQLRGVLSGIGLFGVGATFAIAGREAAKFEDIMIFVRANARLLGKDGKKAFKELEAAARKMGATTRFTAVQAAEGLNQLVLGGLDAKDAMGALPNVLDLAASTTLDFGQAAKIVVNNMVKYNLVAKDTARIGDFLSSAQSRAQTTAEELAQALDGLGSIAADTGVSFRDSVALMTGMAKAGTQGAQGGVAMAIAIGRLINPPKEAADALEELNVQVSDFTGPGGALDLIGLLKEIATSMPTSKVERGAKAIQLFGQRGRKITGILSLLKRGRFVEDVAEGLEKDLGRAARVAAARMNTFIGVILKTKSALSEFAIAALTPVLKAFEPLLGVIMKMSQATSFMTQKFVDLNKSMGGMIGRMVLATTGVLAFVRVVMLIGPAARLAAAAIRIATLSTGWFALVAVVGTVIAGIFSLIEWLKKTDVFQKALAESARMFGIAWERVKEAFTIIGNAIITGLKSILEWLGITREDIEKLPDTVGGMASRALQFISSFVLNATEFFVAILENWGVVWGAMPGVAKVALSFMFDLVVNFTKIMPQLFGFGLRKAFDLFIWFAEMVAKLMWTLVKTIVKTLAQIPRLIWDAIRGRDISLNIAKGISDALGGFGKGLAGELPDLSSVFVPSKRTKKLIKDELGGVLEKIEESKRRLEAKRIDALPKLEEGRKIAQEAVAERQELRPSKTEKGAVRFGFRAFGKHIQDVLLKGKDDKDAKRNDLLALGLKKQDLLIAAVEKIGPPGAAVFS